MNEMCLVSRVPHQLGRIVLAGLLACLTVLSGVSPTEADDNTRPTTKPAMSLDAQKLFAQASPAVVKIHTYNATGRPLGQGSGFLIDAAGTIVTNHHVIKDAASARVYIQERASLPLTRIVAVDKQADLAIIKVDGKDLPFLELRVALPKVGEKVFAIGSPRGLTNTLSDGLVSGLRRDSGITEIQTSAPITHGSSGGPLLSSSGAVVGVTTKGRIGGANLNFAVPAERVASLLKKPSLPSPSTSRFLKPPEAKAAEAPKVYKSLASLLSKMPRDLLPTNNKNFTALQQALIQKWIANNVHPGTVLGFTGKLSQSGYAFRNHICVMTDQGALYYKPRKSDTTNADGISLYLESPILIRGRKGWLWVRANINDKLAQTLLKLKKETNLTINGKVGMHHPPSRYGNGDECTLQTYWYFRNGYHYYVINLYLTDCVKGEIRLPKKRPRTSRPASKRTDEDKARSQFSLAKSYINAGLKAKAMEVLKELIAKYPKTRAATDAQAALEKLGKQ